MEKISFREIRKKLSFFSASAPALKLNDIGPVGVVKIAAGNFDATHFCEYRLLLLYFITVLIASQVSFGDNEYYLNKRFNKHFILRLAVVHADLVSIINNKTTIL